MSDRIDRILDALRAKPEVLAGVVDALRKNEIRILDPWRHNTERRSVRRNPATGKKGATVYMKGGDGNKPGFWKWQAFFQGNIHSSETGLRFKTRLEAMTAADDFMESHAFILGDWGVDDG